MILPYIHVVLQGEQSPEAVHTRRQLDQYVREVRAVRQQRKREEALEYGLLKAIVKYVNVSHHTCTPY